MSDPKKHPIPPHTTTPREGDFADEKKRNDAAIEKNPKEMPPSDDFDKGR